MARKLFERGSKLAFNTLRKYSREVLEAMLARADTHHSVKEFISGANYDSLGFWATTTTDPPV
jgi:hypothetical protein